MRGYRGQKDATAQAIKDGWLFMGDLGYQDEDGYIYLQGRAKDFIKPAAKWRRNRWRTCCTPAQVWKSAQSSACRMSMGRARRRRRSLQEREAATEDALLEACYSSPGSSARAGLLETSLPRQLAGQGPQARATGTLRPVALTATPAAARLPSIYGTSTSGVLWSHPAADTSPAVR